ncbi:MAG: tripartite tricarboxylate transporter substrate-binding protein [Beijerinckiaceae bacterium]|nr:tripartite tricarboxylate transporter substrate-binding protein [Beijerinckiaceae bacterium]
MNINLSKTMLAATAATALMAGAVHAQEKPFNIYIGYSAGGGYDVYGRTLARHINKHLPGNPNVVVNNMPGAGSMRLANWLYNVAPKDGNNMGIFARGIAFDTLLGQPGAQFDATKFAWIGSANDEVSVCVAWHTSGVTKFEQVLEKELVVGGTGGSADTDQFPKVFNSVLGAKMKIVAGYPGGNDINLAMERGEVSGRCGWSWSSVITTQPGWLKEKKINVLVQLSLEKHADLPDVPIITDFAKDDITRGVFRLVFARQVMGRPFAAPPGTPPERVEVIRKAFMATLKDPQLLAEADKAQLEITPVSGDVVQKLVQEAYSMPPEVIKRTIEALR